MSTEAAAVATTNGANSGTTSITLDAGSPDVDELIVSGKEQSTQVASAGAQPGTAETPTTTAPKPEDKPTEKKPDADELALELSRRTRETQASKKAHDASKAELDKLVARHKEFDSVLGLAKTDPTKFVERMAEAVNLPLDTVVEVLIARKQGSSRALTPEETAARAAKDDAEAKEAKRLADEQKAAGDKAVQTHKDSIKSLVSASDKFPLFTEPEEMEGNVDAAFDLMVLAFEASQTDKDVKPLSYAAAVDMIEKQLHAKAERSASKLGYKKTETLAPAEPAKPAAVPATPAPTAPATQPATPPINTASVAPIVASNGIRSDEEIAADWSNSWANLRR